ncbi:MAG TPA: 5-dehydro-2-deoxygluconokinase [Steroidobacteraceae bacterium]|nr:5-dehydro-2-deoxygluconokinase [Steroidobacteraceae bacterium]
MQPALDLVAIGRVSVDLYGQQLGSRLEDIATFAKGVGGCPANVAIGAARLGLKSALITRVGDEPMGRFVREQLEREGVDTRAVHVDRERLTPLVLLSVRDRDTFPLIFYRENCADSALSAADIDAGLIASARAVLVTGTHFSLAAGARAQRKAIDIARTHAGKVVLDVDYRPNLWGIGGHGAGASRYARSARVTEALSAVLPDCDLIVGTEEELHIAAGREDTLEAVRHIRERSDAVIVCKRGAGGCVVFAGRIPASVEDGLVVPGMDVEVCNVLGAGDAFLAGFLLGYLRAQPHERSARYGNACGALAVSRLLCSSEFPSRVELDHYLDHGSAERALRNDAQLGHLHWVTTQRRGPANLWALALPAPIGAGEAPRVAEEPAERRLERLAVEAAARVAAGRTGFGVLLDSTSSAAALHAAQGKGLWLAREVAQPLSRPLEFAGAASLAVHLTEWPTGVAAACRCQYHPQDPRELREAQERNLLRLAAACRSQGRELALEVSPGGSGVLRADTEARVLSRLYELGIRPDWWVLEPQPRDLTWESCARVIGAADPYCRGILVALRTPGDEERALLATAAGSPIVRGFIAGGSMIDQVAPARLSREMSAESVIARMAERFRALVDAWIAVRDRRFDRPEGGGR